MTFADVVIFCLDDEDFMAEYRRLTGSTIGLSQHATIDVLIDKATGYVSTLDVLNARAFFDFVRVAVWNRLPDDVGVVPRDLG